MEVNKPRFSLESELVEQFCERLTSPDSPWGEVSLAKEFEYSRGRADIIAADCDERIIAFEAKLFKWREALQQAYRNTCFAHKSYVLLPEENKHLAERFEYEFARRSVGLCYLKEDQIIITIESREKKPIQKWLSEKAIAATQS